MKVWLSTGNVDYSGATAPDLHRLLHPGDVAPLRAHKAIASTLLEASLATSLMMVCTGAVALSRSGGFPGARDGLDAAGSRDAAGVCLPQRFAQAVRCSPALGARETAVAMGLTASVEPALADIDHGVWSGLAFADIDESQMLVWLGDPTQGAPGGESMAAVQARVGGWLDDIARASGAICAITHATTIRAALAHALGLPLAATLAIDLAPLSRTLLSFNGRWRLQALVPN